MPSLIDLRRRIRSVKNMQQITKAMKMVSAAKLRRAQEHALGSRPYAAMMGRVLANVARAAASLEEANELPLLQVREEKKIRADPGQQRYRSCWSFQRESLSSRPALYR